jgi:hypothetical protein
MKPGHITRNPGGEAKEKSKVFVCLYSGGGFSPKIFEPSGYAAANMFFFLIVFLDTNIKNCCTNDAFLSRILSHLQTINELIKSSEF